MAERRLTHREIVVILLGLMTGLALAGLDQTIVATALPTIVGDLGGLEHLSWVVTAYLLTSTVTTPVYGKLSDLYGRRPLFQGAIGVFIIGSALCGLAQNMTQLVLFRAVQGVGAGGLLSMAFAIIADVIPPRDRGRYTGYLAGTFAFTNVVGPLLGGVLVDHLSWRWIFYVNVPLGIASLIVTTAVLKLPFARRPARVDVEGAVLLVSGMTCLLLALVWGGDVYAWDSAPVLMLFAAAGVQLVAFGVWETLASDPLIPLRLFRNSVVTNTSAVSFLLGLGLFGVVVFLPLYLQVVRGQSTTNSGLLLSPMMLGVVAAAVVCGRLIVRFGRYKRFAVGGMALILGAMVGLSTMTSSTPSSVTTAWMVLLGVGAGMASPVLVLAGQNAVDPGDLGVATSASIFSRSLGASIGVAAFGAVLNARLAIELRRHVPGGAGVVDRPEDLVNSPDQIAALPSAVREGVVEAIAESVTTVFRWAIPAMFVAVVLTLLLRELPLRQHVGAASADEASEPETEWAASG